MKIYAIAALFFLLASVSVSYADVGSSSMSVPAVTGVTTAALTRIQLNVTYGSGSVKIVGPANVSSDTYQSAREASYVGSVYSGLNQSAYNFTFTIFDNSSDVSGPSGGLAMTLLTISALTHRQLPSNFSATGTISANGSVGEIGGVYDKAGAVKRGGKAFFLVPTAPSGGLMNLIYFLSQQHYNLTMTEVGNISQAASYTFGSASPRRLTFNVSDNGTIAAVPPFNQSCTDCSTQQFGMLANDTFNFTIGELDNLTGNYSAFKQDLLSQISSYRLLASKGYIYASANLAFAQALNLFLLTNQGSLNQSSASLVIDNVANYCSTISPPLMTSSNYEYVVGGELRQTWANITLNDSSVALSQVSTSDGIAQVLVQVGSAYSWCFAAQDMYKIASNMSSNSSYFVTLPRSARQSIFSDVEGASTLSTNLYSRAATQDYKLGWYGAALYNSQYANAFENLSVFGSYTNAQLVNMTKANIANSTYGIWAHEFGAQAYYYLFQAGRAGGSAAATSYIGSAYTVSLLSSRLSSSNMFLNSSFTQLNVTNSSIVASVSAIQDQVSQIYSFLTIITFLVFIIFLLLLVILLKQHQIHLIMKERQATRPAARSRRR